jgi:hypothetical protein
MMAPLIDLWIRVGSRAHPTLRIGQRYSKHKRGIRRKADSPFISPMRRTPHVDYALRGGFLNAGFSP